jgi:hypothetical protein
MHCDMASGNVVAALPASCAGSRPDCAGVSVLCLQMPQQNTFVFPSNDVPGTIYIIAFG